MLKKMRLGKTELMVTKTSIGCLPLQRCTMEDAISILRRSYDAGINFFDTANFYTDSEEKIGRAFEGIRHNVIISTKSMALDAKTITEHIETSLRRMKTDYIDLFQFHNVQALIDHNDPQGPYAAALEAKKKGYVRHIGATTHRLKTAVEYVESGVYETMQYPFSYLSAEDEVGMVSMCKERDMGFIAMKGLAGGMLNNVRVCHAFMNQYENVVPIWGVQTIDQLEQWIVLGEEDPKLDDEMRSIVETDRKKLADNFCRGCGYCAPCPVDIEIHNLARIDMLLRRAPWRPYFTEQWQKKLNKINDCTGCGACASKCPYKLNTPELLKFMLKEYNNFYEQHRHEI